MQRNRHNIEQNYVHHALKNQYLWKNWIMGQEDASIICRWTM